MKQILAAVDFSDLATCVLEHAASQALAFGGRVHIIHVETPVAAFIGNEIGPQLPPPEQHLEETLQQQTDLQAMAAHLQSKGIEATWQLLQGSVPETIVEKALELKSDLIIAGAHNHGFLYRAFIGSVSTSVVKHAPCPMLIVPQK